MGRKPLEVLLDTWRLAYLQTFKQIVAGLKRHGYSIEEAIEEIDRILAITREECPPARGIIPILICRECGAGMRLIGSTEESDGYWWCCKCAYSKYVGNFRQELDRMRRKIKHGSR